MLFQTYGKMLLSIFLIGLIILSFSYIFNGYFQRQQQQQQQQKIIAYAQKQITFNGSNPSSGNELSNALLKQFKTKVFTTLSSNSSIRPLFIILLAHYQ